MKEILAALITALVFATGVFLYQKNVDVPSPSDSITEVSQEASSSPESSIAQTSESKALNSELNQLEKELSDLDTLLNFDDF